MLTFIRLIGVLNAAVWLGAGVFFTFGIGPAVFSPEMKRIFGDYYPGVIAQMFIARYFKLQLICGIIAALHFAAELVLARRGFQKWTFLVLVVPLSLGLIGGFVLQPKMNKLHAIKYSNAPAEEREAAAKQFGMLHGISQVVNLVGLLLLGAYAWRTATPPQTGRFVTPHQFRG